MTFESSVQNFDLHPTFTSEVYQLDKSITWKKKKALVRIATLYFLINSYEINVVYWFSANTSVQSPSIWKVSPLEFHKNIWRWCKPQQQALGQNRVVEISWKHKSSKISLSALSSRQRGGGGGRGRMWAFEWKVIQHSACHGSQRKTTSSCCLLQHRSCQRLFWCFCPVVTSLFEAEGSSRSPTSLIHPPTVRVRTRAQALQPCEAGEVEVHLQGLTFFFTQPRNCHRSEAGLSTGPGQIWSARFGCSPPSASP